MYVLILKLFPLYLLLFSFSYSQEVNKLDVRNFEALKAEFIPDKGQTLVINFWATWCAPCVKELPYFEAISEAYNEDDVEVILVSLDFPQHYESKLKPFISTRLNPNGENQMHIGGTFDFKDTVEVGGGYKSTGYSNVMLIVKTKFGHTAAYAYDFGTPNGQAAVTRSGNEIFLKFKF